MKVYYNENDAFAAAWLRELVKGKHIPDGCIDERSIKDVDARDLAGFEQVHLFAGIGGWAEALRLAGWDEPVWTGSCPCQPFSAAGKRRGVKDDRHLWPELYRLIRECRPATVFGEQVASKDGREWLAGIHADLEGMGYAFGAADLCAAGVGAPHIRQRLYWVADAERGTRQFDGHEMAGTPRGIEATAQERQRLRADARDGGEPDGLADAGRDPGDARRLADRSGEGDGAPGVGPHAEPRRHGDLGGVGDADDARSQGRIERGDSSGQWLAGASGVGFWSDFDIIPCLDGKARRVPSGAQSVLLGVASGVSAGVDGCGVARLGHPLAQGVKNRVGSLRGFGNAIVPELAAEFVRAFMESER